MNILISVVVCGILCSVGEMIYNLINDKIIP